MKLVFEVDVEIDEPVTDGEREQLREHLRRMLSMHGKHIGPYLPVGPCMLGTVCRYAFVKKEGRVEE